MEETVLINLDNQPVVTERIWGTVPVRLTGCQLGHTLGILIIIPIRPGNEVRLLITEPRGVKDFLERTRGGEKMKTYNVFGRKEVYPVPLHNGPSFIYFNIQNPGSALGALVLCLCGLGHQVNWGKVNLEETLGRWRPIPDVMTGWEKLLLPTTTQAEQLALQNNAASSLPE